MTEQTLTTRPPATYTPTPPVPPGAEWEALCEANPSLRSWERSAATAGSKQLGWWLRWAWQTPLFRRDINLAVGRDATDEVFFAALDVARRKIRETFEAGRVAAEQAKERERVAAARAPAPPARPKWRAWP
jgi:hypothetical protein